MPPLRVLVAVPHDNDARKLARFLGERGCETLLERQGDLALERVRSARGRAEPIELLLADHRLHALDGLSLIGEAHRIEPAATGCLLIDAHRIDDRLRQEARTLGCRHILAIPLDYGRLGDLVERLHRQRGSATAARPAGNEPPTASHDESPFFGTRRLTPGTGRVTVGTGRFTPPIGEPLVEDGSGVFDAALSPPAPTPSGQTHLYRAMEGTGRTTRRRSLDGTHDSNRRDQPGTRGRPPVTGSFDEPPATPTQRIRRGITGRIDRQQQDEVVREATNRITRSSRTVACAHCGQSFSVARKDEAYTMPCIHCGGVNTIAAG